MTVPFQCRCGHERKGSAGQAHGRTEHCIDYLAGRLTDAHFRLSILEDIVRGMKPA